MGEQIQDQVSAFTDDELSAEESRFFVRRLENDSASRGKALRYLTIGAALRGELLNPDPQLLCRRLDQALTGLAPAAPEGIGRPNWGRRLIRPALGAGIAATVAVVSLLALNRADRLIPADPGIVMTAQRSGGSDVSTEALSYVVPQSSSSAMVPVEPSVAPPIRLTDYLVQHGAYAWGIGRTSIDSNVLSERRSWAVVTREQSEE